MATTQSISTSLASQPSPYHTSTLHLVDAQGDPVDPAIAYGVTRAYLALSKKWERLDPALLANWAEDTARHMQAKFRNIQYPGAFAYKHLQYLIFNFYQLKKNKLETVGELYDLGTLLVGSPSSVHHDMEYRRILNNVRASLDDRENLILSLLMNGYTLPEMISILGSTHDHGRKLIGLVKTKVRRLLSYWEPRADRRHCAKVHVA